MAARFARIARRVERLAAGVDRAERSLGGNPAVPCFGDWLPIASPSWIWHWPHLQVIRQSLDRVTRGEIDRLAIFLPPRHGKCLAAGSPVLLADGRIVPIEKVRPTDMVASIGAGYNVVSSEIIRTYTNGVRPVLRVTLASGREVLCTENHPFLTVLGWREAGALAVGDRVASMRQTPIPEAEPLPDGYAAIMGYLIGDGSYGKGNVIISAADPDVIAHILSIVTSHGWSMKQIHKYDYYIGRPTRFGPKRLTPRAIFLKYMTPAKSPQKRVPPRIFQACRADLCAFLGAYFNCDGTVTTCREGVAEFGSSSEGLLRDTQVLLTRLGIYSTLASHRGKYKGEDYYSWRLTVSGKDVITFADCLPVVGKKGEKLRKLAEKIKGRRHFPDYDAIPPEWVKLRKPAKRGRGLRRLGVRIDKKYKHGTARDVVRRVAELEGNEEIARLCSPEIIWERIIKIEPAGERPTFDIEVNGTHNFITGDIVVHNSEMTTVRYPVWRMEREPATRVILAAHTQRFAEKLSRKARRVARGRVALSRERNSATEWETTAGGGLMACGVGSPPTGSGGNILLIDDPIKKQEEAKSETYREKMWEWYTDDLMTRLEPGGAVILIQTRWNEDDLAGRILTSDDAPNWTVVNLPALAEEADPLGRKVGEALCPERYDREALLRKQRLNPLSFAALYQQRPTPQEGNIFKRADFDKVVPALPAGCRLVRYWDTAGTDGGGCFTAGCLMAKDAEGFFYVVDVKREQFAAPERERLIRATAHEDQRLYGKVEIVIEEQGGSSGKEVVQASIRSLAGFDASADRPTGNKEVRASPFADQCAAGNVRLVKGDWIKDYLDELCGFPHGKYMDQVDASSGAFARLAGPEIDWSVREMRLKPDGPQLAPPPPPPASREVRYFAATGGYQPVPVVAGEKHYLPDFKTEEEAVLALALFKRALGVESEAETPGGLTTESRACVEEKVQAYLRSRRLA